MTLRSNLGCSAQTEGQLSSNGAPAIAAIRANPNLGFARRSQAALQSCQNFEGGGVVKFLRGFACGPVALLHTQKVRIKNKKPLKGYL
jgi:hypothetical protein